MKPDNTTEFIKKVQDENLKKCEQEALPRINGRPDLSYLTKAHISFEQGKGLTISYPGETSEDAFVLFKYGSFLNSIETIPALVQIAEMFYDHLKPQGDSLAFSMVSDTLEKLKQC